MVEISDELWRQSVQSVTDAMHYLGFSTVTYAEMEIEMNRLHDNGWQVLDDGGVSSAVLQTLQSGMEVYTMWTA